MLEKQGRRARNKVGIEKQKAPPSGIHLKDVRFARDEISTANVVIKEIKKSVKAIDFSQTPI